MEIAMPNCFVIRTTDEYKKWIWDEIQHGRLRQGWGLSNMELPADPAIHQQAEDWCERFMRQGEGKFREKMTKENALYRLGILRPMKNVQPEDIIVVPKMPDFSSYCIVSATGEYTFDGEERTPTELNDFHHIIPVRIENVFHRQDNPTAQTVYKMLRPYRKAVNIVRDTNFKSAILGLLK